MKRGLIIDNCLCRCAVFVCMFVFLKFEKKVVIIVQWIQVKTSFFPKMIKDSFVDFIPFEFLVS